MLQIFLSIRGCWPLGPNLAGVLVKHLTDPEQLGCAQVRQPFSPIPCLQLRDGAPITVDEFLDVLAIHNTSLAGIDLGCTPETTFNHFPVKAGLRFSMKDLIPSFESSDWTTSD